MGVGAERAAAVRDDLGVGGEFGEPALELVDGDRAGAFDVASVVFLLRTDVDEHGESKRSIWIRVYTPTITTVLRNRWTALGVVILSGILFVASLALIPLLPTQFIDPGGEKLVQVSIAPPTGTSSEAVLEQAIAAEEILQADEDVELIQTSIPGEGDTSFQTIFAARLSLSNLMLLGGYSAAGWLAAEAGLRAAFVMLGLLAAAGAAMAAAALRAPRVDA